MLSSSILDLQRKRLIELQVSVARLQKEIDNLRVQQENFRQDFETERAVLEDNKFQVVKQQEESRKRLLDVQRNSIEAQEDTNKAFRKREDFKAMLKQETATRQPNLDNIANANKGLTLATEEEEAAKAREKAIWEDMLLLGDKMKQCADDILLLEEKMKDLEVDNQIKMNDFMELITRLQVLAESQQAEILNIEQEILDREQKLAQGPSI